MYEITLEEVEKLAKLARLGLTEKEKENLAPQMTEILNFAKQLSEVEVSGVEPTSQVTGLSNVFVEDSSCLCNIPLEELIANAPETDAGFIKVRSVL